MHKIKLDSEFDHILKIVVIGNSGVGKTNIIKRFNSDEFDVNSRSTVGFEFVSKEVNILTKKVKIQIWDTAGQERYKSITSSFYKASNWILCVFDLTKFNSFEKIDEWVNEARNITGNKPLIYLVGNKSDLKNMRCVKKEEALQKVEELKLDGYIETSALMNIRIDESFMKLTTCNFKFLILEIIIFFLNIEKLN